MLLFATLMPSIVWAASFYRLIVDGQLDAVRQAIAHDTDLATMNDELGRSPLHLAVINGHMAIVNVLINAGADVNSVDSLKGWTPMHYAAFYRFPDIFLFLLSRRGDFLIADRSGNLPMHIAAATGCPKIVKHLLLHAASPDCLNDDWQTPLHLAAKSTANRPEYPAASENETDYLEVTRLLLEAGATKGIHDIWRNLPETLALKSSRRSDFSARFNRLMRDCKPMQ